MNYQPNKVIIPKTNLGSSDEASTSSSISTSKLPDDTFFEDVMHHNSLGEYPLLSLNSFPTPKNM